MTDLSKVLPHKNPMILLDDIIEVDLENKFVKTNFYVDNKKKFYDKTYWLYALKFNLPLVLHYLSQIVLATCTPDADA